MRSGADLHPHMQGTVDEEGTQALLDQAFKAGINTFDTAETYSGGLAESACGRREGR
jgi:aryl-alcohol dehydrogenase-like predicted oxidoreductase